MPPLALTFYGDDFTGSTDVMEVLTWAGLETVLFVEPPDAARLARFPGARAVGLAGESRGRGPEWMDAHLPGLLGRLAELGAPLCHYKVCSTFDSSPQAGSIGRALEIGQDLLGTPWVPIVVGAPKLNRYQVFGNLFATVGEEAHRLDRHPTMSRHPVTPMDEADLRRHLARQTDRPVGLVDILALKAGRGEARLAAEVAAGARAVLFDALDEASLLEVGRLIWEKRPAERTFAVASSGLQYALTAYWRSRGWLGLDTRDQRTGAEAERIVVVSGSGSPETAASIRTALEGGYAGVRLDPRATAAGETGPAVREAAAALEAGRNAVLYTALGPDDPGIVRGDAALRERLGAGLGAVLRQVLDVSGVRRAVVCGGDTSSSVGQSLGIYALTAIAPLAPGSPLCRAWAEGPADGLEIVFKGGQRGGPGFFEEARRGRLAEKFAKK
ncbi:MAG: four-carbon acid sugar kinase family protein [Acidobacteria bacterium]|nr:four-carbon acid sugar kinase family protein [Acidobacteriota bacterium]